jgi:hypothetical protein
MGQNINGSPGRHARPATGCSIGSALLAEHPEWQALFPGLGPEPGRRSRELPGAKHRTARPEHIITRYADWSPGEAMAGPADASLQAAGIRPLEAG